MVENLEQFFLAGVQTLEQLIELDITGMKSEYSVERLLQKLMPATRREVRCVELIRDLVWRFYKALKVWKQQPSPQAAHAFRRRFDRIFTLRTGYNALDTLLARLRRRRRELLKVLEHPEIPLHTNASENDLRAFVTKRKISGGTMSPAQTKFVA